MLGKPVRMKCGHIADTIMMDVPHNSELINVAACSICFDQFGTATQLASAIDTITRENIQHLQIKRNYVLPLLGIVICILTIITLVVSLKS